MSPPLDQGGAPRTYPRIGDLVAELRVLRLKSHHSRYGEAALPELPSKKATAEIIDALVAAMFPRHFGPPGLAGEEDLLLLSASGDVLCPGTGKPKALETVLHMGIYQAREDVGAICRTHSPWAVAWGLRAEAFQPAHGFGLMMGASVPYHPEGNLVSSPAAALSAARTLGDARGLFLKGNGLAVVGTTLREAVIRALYLEEACRGVLCSGGVPDRARFTEAERDDRSAWHDAELARAWAYYSARASSRIPK